MSQRLFLSAVSDDYASVRNWLAEQLRRGGFGVTHQKEFVEVGQSILVKLARSIEAESDIVLHVVGPAVGSLPTDDEIAALMNHCAADKLAAKFPELFAGEMYKRLTYTQWEAWLGVFYGKIVISYLSLVRPPATFFARLRSRLSRCLSGLTRRPAVASRLPIPTADHLEMLKGRHVGWPTEFTDQERLLAEIQTSLNRLFNQGSLAASDGRRPNNLPFGSIGTLFKGRDDVVDQLRQKLVDDPKRPLVIVAHQAIYGEGGVGKTRLAVEYGIKHAGDYSALLFISATTPETLRTDLAALAGPMVLNLPNVPAGDFEAALALVLGWLDTHPGWFLVIDNVDSEASATAVEDLLHKLRSGHVVITSRIRNWSEGVKSLELDVLSEDASTEFLLEATARKGSVGRSITPTDEQDARGLAKDVDGLALALEQSAAYIRTVGTTIAAYRKRWAQFDEKVRDWHDPRLMKYPRSVAATWQSTFDQLPAASIAVLRMCSMLAPAPIPIGLLAAGFPDLDADLAPLLKFSLAKKSPAGDTVRVHRLIQEIVAWRMDAETAAAAAKAARDSVVAYMPKGHPQTEVAGWPVWATLTGHVPALAEHLFKHGDAAEAALLLNECGQYLDAQARLIEAEPLMRRALAIDEASYGKDHPNVAVRLNNLAQLLQATNRLTEAEPLMRRALAIDEASFGKDHPNVARDLNNLAQLLQATNRLTEAEPLMRRALAIDEASFGKDHPNVARDLNNLASLLQATNRLTEAEPLMRRALAIDEASFGKNHPDVAIDLNNLATLLQATNRLTEAEPLMRRVVDIFEISYGKDHPNVATALNNQAQLLQDINRLTEAEPLMRRALAIDEASFGKDHPKVAIRLNNLATLLQATNRLTEAEPLMRRVVDIFEISYGKDHPNVATALNNLALLLKATDRLAEAEPLMIRALAIDEASFGKDHPKVAIRLNNLAQLLQATNRLSEAEPLMRRALAIDEASFGKDHPNVAIRLNNLAQLLQVTNRLTEAEPLIMRALAIDEASFGKDHPNVARDLNNLAQLLQATNRLTEAEPLMVRALAIDEASFGNDHPNVARDLNNLAQLLQATNRLTEAEPLMRQALAIDEASFGKDHPNVAIRLNNLALLLQATDRLTEAEPLMRRALAIDEASFGKDHPNVARDLVNLMSLLRQTGRDEEKAALLIRRAVQIRVDFTRATGHRHPRLDNAVAHYRSLLLAMGRTADEANAVIREICPERFESKHE